MPPELLEAQSLALSALTAILKDPTASVTNRRLAAASILRHCASMRPKPASGRARSPAPAASSESASPPAATPSSSSSIPRASIAEPPPPLNSPPLAPAPDLDPPRAATEPHFPDESELIRPGSALAKIRAAERQLSAMSRLIDLAGGSRSARRPLAKTG